MFFSETEEDDNDLSIDEKRKKNEYNHSQPKTNDNTNNCYTN